MTDGRWQPVPDELRADDALLAGFVEEHRLIYDRVFRDDLDINHQLPVMTHAFRRLDQWRVFLLLTPWMLARVFVPDNPPDLEIPANWHAETRGELAYTVMGPAFNLSLLTGKQKAHLNYSTNIGHYLLHPLILNMGNYQTPNEVFRAWNKVIEARNENLEKMRQQNQKHREISRREFFSGVIGK